MEKNFAPARGKGAGRAGKESTAAQRKWGAGSRPSRAEGGCMQGK